MTWWTIAWLAACVGEPEPDVTAPPTDTAAADTDTPAPALVWERFTHPCAGATTDALLRVPNGPTFVGCGSSEPGLGLYVSVDRGETWSLYLGSPETYFEDFRVVDLSLGGDGLLYVAGENVDHGERAAEAVVAITPDSTLGESLAIFENGRDPWSDFRVGAFVRTPALSVAASDVSPGVVWRAGDVGPWQDGAGWASDGAVLPLLDLVAGPQGVYGSGATAEGTHAVFLPPRVDTPGLHMDTVPVGTSRGALVALRIDGAAIVAVGTDEDAQTGLIARSGADPYDPTGWTTSRLDTLFPGEATTAEAVCGAGDDLVVVGNRAGAGLAVRSQDGGATWTDVSPPDAPRLTACQTDLDGTLYVAGADGLFARAAPP